MIMISGFDPELPLPIYSINVYASFAASVLYAPQVHHHHHQSSLLSSSSLVLSYADGPHPNHPGSLIQLGMRQFYFYLAVLC